jgi:hypothetical protein
MGQQAHLTARPRETSENVPIGYQLSAIGYARSASAIGYFFYGAFDR